MIHQPIYSVTPFTLLDYPDITACIFWFAGCNMRCDYCYNPEIVTGKGKFSYEDALGFLTSRKALLDGVVFSGGECTLHNDIDVLAKQIHEMGLKVKVDTNGSRPKVLANLFARKLIDYVALDYKAPANRFEKITHSDLFYQFEKSLDLLMEGCVPFEVRCTVHSSLFDCLDIEHMVTYLVEKGYTGRFYLQHYINGTDTLSPLPRSAKLMLLKEYETSDIQVVWRN